MASNEHANTGPRRVLSQAGPAWLTYALVALTVLVLAGGLWAVVAPESMARVLGRWRNQPLQIEKLVLSVDQQAVELAPDGTTAIHPGQRFAIAGLESNRWRNYDLSLYSRDFDITAVTGGASATPRDLLPGDDFDRPREMRVEVRDQDRPVAAFTIVGRFTALDFVARGDAAATAEAKVDNYQKALEADPASAQVRDKLIEALVETGRPDRAAEVLEAELVRGGPDEELLQRLLVFYRDLAMVPKQVETLGRLIKLAESQGRPTTAYQVQLAGAYRDGGRPDRAAEIFETLLEGATPEQTAAYLSEMVDLYRGGRDAQREIETLKRLAALVPPDQASSLWAKLAERYEESGDESGRLAAWRALADSLPEGQSKVNALKMTGLLLYKAKQYDEARAVYLSAQKMAPDDGDIPLNLARLSAARGDQAAYREHLAKVIELEPENLDRRRELAEALAAANQNDKAKAQYRAIVARRPDDRATRLILMGLMEKTGDKKGLIEQYAQLAERLPQDKVVAYNFGALLFADKQMNRAIEAFQKVVKLDPKDLEAREYLVAAYQRLGKSREKEMLAEALAIYRQDPARTVYRTLLLNSYENAKNWAKFAETAEVVTKLEPKSPVGWESLARARTAQKQPKAAAEAWLKAGAAQASQKKTDQARQAYKKALELDPENKAASQALSELEAKKDQKNS